MDSFPIFRRSRSRSEVSRRLSRESAGVDRPWYRSRATTRVRSGGDREYGVDGNNESMTRR